MSSRIADGVVRHSLLVLPYGRSKNLDDWDLYGSLDVQAVRLFQGLPDQQTVLDFSETGVTAARVWTFARDSTRTPSGE